MRQLQFIFPLLLIISCSAPENLPSRPNIVLIMADDMGYSDIGSYGGEIRTPALDQLAGNGLRFTQFYNGARCCPTRASLLTGLYPHQTGIGYMVSSNPQPPGYLGDLNNQCATIAEVLGEAGYENYMSGKWHITPHLTTSNTTNWPLQRGFDKFYGTITGAGSYFDPATLTYNNDSIVAPDEFYYTYAISDSAASFIEAHLQSKSNPFFLYVSYTAPHWPLHAPEETINPYKGIFNSGWDQLREERLNRMKKMGLLPSEFLGSLRDPAIPSWDSITDKSREVRKMEVYAAQVSQMDRGIGSIISALEKGGILDNTLVLFLADNGGCAEEFYQDTPWVRRYGPAETRDGSEVIFGNDSELVPGGPDSYQSYGLNWANLSNTPFRFYKHYAHEGGISSPFIVHWPDHIEDKGGIRNSVGHIIDVLPTIIEAAGAEYPTAINNNQLLPPEGLSLLNVINTDSMQSRPLFWEHGNNRAVRKGKWKLVATSNGNWELYDIDSDRAESRNLIADHPGVAGDLEAEWNKWALRTHVLPKPD